MGMAGGVTVDRDDFLADVRAVHDVRSRSLLGTIADRLADLVRYSDIAIASVNMDSTSAWAETAFCSFLERKDGFIPTSFSKCIGAHRGPVNRQCRDFMEPCHGFSVELLR
jgi:hypothetical protein